MTDREQKLVTALDAGLTAIEGKITAAEEASKDKTIEEKIKVWEPVALEIIAMADTETHEAEAYTGMEKREAVAQEIAKLIGGIPWVPHSIEVMAIRSADDVIVEKLNAYDKNWVEDLQKYLESGEGIAQGVDEIIQNLPGK